MSSPSSFAPELQAHEWEWEHPESHEWEHPESHESHEWEWEHPEAHEWEHPEAHESHEWEWENERANGADPFLPFLLPLAAKALPALGRLVMPAVRRLIPVARRAIGTTIRNVLDSGPGAAPGTRAPAARGTAPPAGGLAQVCPPGYDRPGRRRALSLIRQLHGIVLRGEAEAEAAEASLFGSAETEWESAHPEAHQAALTEVLAAEAAHTASEAEAEALLGAALPITISIMSGRRLRRLTPSLVRANAGLVLGLRRSGPAGPQLLRLVPKIQRTSVATISQMQRSGRQVTPAMVAPIVAASAARVLGTPGKCGPALVRNAVIRQQTVAPARRRHRHPAY